MWLKKVVKSLLGSSYRQNPGIYEWWELLYAPVKQDFLFRLHVLKVGRFGSWHVMAPPMSQIIVTLRYICAMLVGSGFYAMSGPVKYTCRFPQHDGYEFEA